MSKKIKKRMVPELRFPEFLDAGDWNEINLIDTANKKVKWSFIGGPFGSNLKSSDYVEKGIRVIQLQNIGDSDFINDYQIFTSVEKANELLSSNIFPGDIIISKMGDPVGRACLIPEMHSRYVMCSDGIRLVVNEQRFNKYFVYSLINSLAFRSLLEKTATGSTRKRIGLEELKNLPMVVPEIEEQQKIADCLASIDELITAETQKLDTLKAHKKGLMQQLFPAEGETVPQLRFPEFRDAEEWNINVLDKLGENLDYKRVPISERDRTYGNIPYYGASGIVDYIDDFIFDEDLLCISEDGANLVSRTYPIAFPISGMTWVNNHAHVLKFNNFYTQVLVENYLNSINLEEFLTGMAQPKLNRAKLDIIPIPLPEPEEQQRIASCLLSIDDLITEHTQKLELLKGHKKGMMQQLFPSVDEGEA